MSEKITKSPQIRFTGFTDAWEQRRLGDVTERVTRKNKDLESTLPLTISAQYGLVDQETFFKKIVASKDVSGYYLLMKGEFAYNKSYSKDYPWGAVKRLDLYDKGVLSTLYITFKPMKVDSDFLVCYYDTNNWHKEVAMRAAEGARNHGLLNITATDFFDTKLFLPKTNDEQQRIGSFFKQLDETIFLQQRELELLKDAKRSLLQKMFPQDGADVPEIRFAGFTDAWKQRRLGEIAEFNPKSILPDEFEYVDLESVIGTDLIAHRTEAKESAPSRAQRLAQRGDVFYQTVRPYQRNNYLYELPYDNYVFSTGYAQMRPSIDSYFLLSCVQEELFVRNVLDRSTGTSYPAINSNDLAEIEINVPIDSNEQVKIGSLFRNLDNLITLHQRELNSLENLKRSLLQQMFI